MIRSDAPPHHETMEASELALPAMTETGGVPASRERDARITAIVRAEHAFIWRLLRRLGVPEASVDDATQQVFCVAARRVGDIQPGSERSFLFGVAMRVASDRRRSPRTREEPHATLEDQVAPTPDPEELAQKRQQRVILDEILDSMPIDLRTVLVLFELEQLTKTEVADLLEIPVGTAVSRLRRARDEFKAQAKRRLARGPRTGEAP